MASACANVAAGGVEEGLFGWSGKRGEAPGKMRLEKWVGSMPQVASQVLLKILLLFQQQGEIKAMIGDPLCFKKITLAE